MGKPTIRVGGVHVSGPLAPWVAGFRSWLEEAGYTLTSSVNQMRLLAHVSRWLDAGHFGVAELTEGRVNEFLAARRAAGYRRRVSRRSLAPLLGFLAAHGALPDAAPLTVAVSPTAALVDSFHRYLLTERGLESSTACAYTGRAARFLASCAANGDVSKVTSKDITQAVLKESATVSVGSVQYFVAALRSFLRFCHIEGLVASDLSAAALTMTGRRRSSLPQGLTHGDADALLRSCDRRRALGRRDYAVVMTLLRLGLRASEVAGLMLDDIKWNAGEIVVRGKGRREDRLPLPVDVGEAIAGYLQRGRPKTAKREVFLTTTAPASGLGRRGVSSTVRRACVRAGLAPVGSHRLRHTLACDMVSVGVPLPEISQVLRHRSLSSTAIYARVDLIQLRSLAQPWPEVRADD